VGRIGSADRGEDGLVFRGIAGGYLDASVLHRRYKVALKRAGLRDLRFHDLRHTFGTQVIGNPCVSIAALAPQPSDHRAPIRRAHRLTRGPGRSRALTCYGAAAHSIGGPPLGRGKGDTCEYWGEGRPRRGEAVGVCGQLSLEIAEWQPARVRSFRRSP